MAKRYGGKYSPDGSSSTSGSENSGFQGARVTPVGARSNVMFVPAIVLAFTSLRGGATDFALGLGAAAIWVFGAFLLREGLKAQAAYNERKIARPPVPRKIGAAILCGLGTVGARPKIRNHRPPNARPDSNRPRSSDAWNSFRSIA